MTERYPTPLRVGLHQPHRSGIPGQLSVAGDEHDPLADRLRQQQAIEWIFVEERQDIDGESVTAGDRELRKAIVEETLEQVTRVDPEVVSIQCAFDGELPDAGGAKEEFVMAISHDGTRGLREAMREDRHPDQE